MYWYLEVMKKYAVFSGRARRKEYWMFQLINVIIVIIAMVLAAGVFALKSIGSQGAVTAIRLTAGLIAVYFLAIFLPSLSVSVRRLHDINFSGWWVLLGFVPMGGLVLLVFHVLDSNPGSNQYGPNPKGVNLPLHAAQYAPNGSQAMANAAGAGIIPSGGQGTLAFCSACGAPIPAPDRFCPQCGKIAY